MKKITLAIALMIFLVSCGNHDSNTVEQQIITYQKQVVALNKKIDALQQKLDKQKKNNKTYEGYRVSVNTQKLTPTEFKHYFSASGEVESVNEAFISPQISGQVVKILVHEGQYVKKGQLLARLETDMIEDNMRELKTSLELATTTYKKQKALWEKQIGSEIQYLQAKTQMESLQNKLASLRTQYDKSLIRSPLDGYVESIDLKEGELAAPGIRFIYVVNLDELYVSAQISETYLSSIHQGDQVELSFPAFPKLHITAPIYKVGKVINKQSRTVEIQLKIKNRNNKLKPNLLAQLRILDYYNPNAIVVPAFLVREDIQGYYLYLARQENNQLVARKQYVKAGKTAQNKMEILEGLSANDQIIVKGYNNVVDGTVLNVVK
jgi:membrane fusion protein (multidrug efflux system)